MPFYMPVVFADWKSITAILVVTGIAQREGDFYYIADLQRLTALVEQGTRWRDLKKSDAFARKQDRVVNSLLTGAPRPPSRCTSRSRATCPTAVDRPKLKRGREGASHRGAALPAPGLPGAELSGLFEDHLALSMGKGPLAAAYESRTVEFWLRNPEPDARWKSRRVSASRDPAA
ncbi:hypothetical protein [Roseateles sp.]|uniref:hypothetical protein n=1 Tax=Roseateles sp. TaxID=1971397 RepID=UPI0031E25EEB